jgi:integrase
MANRTHGTGSITQRSEGTWSLRYYAPGEDGKFRQVRETVKGSQAKAEKELRARLSNLDQGAYVDKKKLAVRPFLDRFMAEYACNKALKTQQGYLQLINAYLGPIAKLPIQKLTARHIQEVYNSLKERGKSPTALALHRLLHKALKWGVEKDILVKNISDATNPPAPAKREMRVWDKESRTKFFQAIKEHKYSDLLRFTMATGLRRGEVCGLRWEYVDFMERQIHIYKKIIRISGKGLVESEPKTEKSKRTVTMTPNLEELLRKVQGTQIGQRDELEDGWVNSGYVFSQPDGRAIDPDLITKAFKKMVKEVGMPHLTPHGLRHQYATAAREAGVDMGIISRNMGHASVAITEDIYAHVTANVMEEAALKIENQLFGK